MMPQAPTPAPLHDITGPWAIPGMPLAVMIGGAVALVVLALLAIWYFVGRAKVSRLTPRQKAIRDLEKLRGQTSTPYEFGVRASDILRAFVRDEFGLDAVTSTSLEFLETLRDNAVFDAHEKDSLAAFLEASDLLKYARAEAGGEEIDQLLDTAERLVRRKRKEAA